MNNQESVSPLVEGVKNGQPKKPELVLWFYCTSCGRVLQVPLRSLGQKAACLSCKTRLTIPSLDENVTGLEVVQKFIDAAHTAAPANEPCPAVPASDFFRPVAPTEKPLAKPAPIPPAPHTLSPPQSPPSHAGPNRPLVTPPTPPQLPSRPQPSPAPEPAVEIVTPQVVAERQPVIEPQAVYDGRQRRSHGGGLKIPRAAHWLSRLIYVGVFIMLFLAGVIHPGIGCLGLVWLIPIFGWNIAQRIPALFLHTFSCPGCGEEYPYVDVWRCGCGYQDHRQRHGISFRCPLCHSRIGRTNCRCCGATILLW